MPPLEFLTGFISSYILNSPHPNLFLKGDECEKISFRIVMSYFRLRHAHDGRYGYRWDTG